MALDLFEALATGTAEAAFTDVKDLRSEFLTTLACGEEGVPC